MKAYLDYLRLATWNMKDALDLFADLRRWVTDGGGKWKTSKWLQYSGHRCDGTFYGMGDQNDKRHYVVDSSGPASNDLFGMSEGLNSLYATRIDLQVTVPQPEDYEPFTAYAGIKEMSKVSCSIIHSDTGSTIYLGARTGDKFARLYQKDLGDDRYLRLEFEIKGRLANVLYLQLREGIRIDTAYNHFLGKAKLPTYIKNYFAMCDDGEIFLQAEKVFHADKQLQWLSSLENTVIKMGNDHYQGPTVKGMLERWLTKIT